jgi:hypothetical protein
VGDLELKKIQNEKDPLENEHECFREEIKLDQYKIEDNWVKVWKDWELEKEKMDEWKKKLKMNCCELK